ncbi:MAG TPA: alpha/beta hydrolase [Burkholderiales bacterium]|nr:alpha/beta hydrolase [Burkholderiales bacterium]
MKPSQSEFIQIRGLRYHCRCWGEERATKLFMLHGWMDVSASFQFLVDALRGNWRVIAPDWRGFGLSEWAKSDGYWFPDYFADLDRLLEHFQPDSPAVLVGHSMGGNVAAMYAGIRAERVAKLVNLEGLGLTGTRAEKAPERYARWLAELREKPAFRDYENFEALAERLRGNNSRLSVEKAAFLARHWGRSKPDGRVELASDPAHKLVNPVLYRVEEAEACWRKVAAPVLWVVGAESKAAEFLKLSPQDLAARKACFRHLTERVIPEAGHMLHHDQPERLAAVIEEFLG